jgi:hypothetical protein
MGCGPSKPTQDSTTRAQQAAQRQRDKAELAEPTNYYSNKRKATKGKEPKGAAAAYVSSAEITC